MDDVKKQRDIAINMLAKWCVSVNDGECTSWDCWDEHYKNAAYRDGPIRDLIDAEIERIIQDGRV